MPRLALDWGDLAYADRAGDRPAMVFLHGTGCDSADWAETFAHLPQPGPRVIGVDFRGHGESGIPARPFALADLAGDVLALLAAERISRAVLVGHSLGGMVALEAARRSEAVAGLVLLEGWTKLLAGRAFGEGRFYGRLDEGAVARIKEKDHRMRRRIPPEVWAAFWPTVQAFDVEVFLGETTLPIHEVYGGLGRQADTRSRLFVPDRPNIHLIWIEGAGHYLPHERPAEVARICLAAWQDAARD